MAQSNSTTNTAENSSNSEGNVKLPRQTTPPTLPSPRSSAHNSTPRERKESGPKEKKAKKKKEIINKEPKEKKVRVRERGHARQNSSSETQLQNSNSDQHLSSSQSHYSNHRHSSTFESIATLETMNQIEKDDDNLLDPDIARWLRLTPHNVINKTNTLASTPAPPFTSINNTVVASSSSTSVVATMATQPLSSSAPDNRYYYTGNDITYTLCDGKKTRFVRGKNQSSSDTILIEFDLVFDHLVSIVNVELDLEEGSVDQSYWRDGRLNSKPISIGKNKLTYTASPGQFTHHFQLSFSARSYGTMYVKKFRFKAISYKPKESSKHTEDLRAMVDNEAFSDVKFCIEKKTLCASRNILSARSEYFNRLLLGRMKEGSNLQETVYVEGTTYEAFYCVILYLYSGILYNITVDLATPMLRLAHQYLLKDLQEELQSFLLVNISTSNSNEVLLIAHELELASLKDYAMGFTLKHVKTFAPLKQQPQLLLEVAEALANRAKK